MVQSAASGRWCRIFLGLMAAFLVQANARAQAKGRDAIDFTAEHYSTNVDTGITHASGNVVVKVGRQIIHSDEMTLNSTTGNIRATGSVIFEEGLLKITGQSSDFNMKTGSGDFYDAVLRLDQQFYLEAKKLSRLEADRYRGLTAKVSSCLDCPQSWSMTGSSIDLEVEGYAEIHHALVQIKDNPVLYFPVFYFPVKTKRQSGFLMPTYSSAPELGSQILIPYFWAHSGYSDSTFEYRYMSKGGNRLWSELRYLYSDRTFAMGQGSFTRSGDLTPETPLNDRYGLSLDQRWQISPNWTERFRGEMESDTRYSWSFYRDFQGTRLPTLVNEPSITWQNDNLYGYGLLKFNRDNLIRERASEAGINKLPELGFSIPSALLFGVVRASADFRHESFRRSTLGYDTDTGWIRSGDRNTIIGHLNVPVNLSVFLWEPLAEIRIDHYLFPDRPSGVAESAARGRLFLDQKFGTTFSRVFKTDLGSLKAIKHSIEPFIRWSYTPPDAKTIHPFFAETNAPRFDIFDPSSPDIAQVQLGSVSEEQRLRPHHLLALALNTRIVGRYGEGSSKSYEEFLGAGISQDINLKGDVSGVGRLSPTQIYAYGAYGGARISTQLARNPNTGDSDVSNEVSYKWSDYAVVLRQRIAKDIETYGYGASVTLLKAWSLGASGLYDSKIARPVEQGYEIGYNGLSKCWFFHFALTRGAGQKDFATDLVIKPIFSAGLKASLF